MLIGDVLYISTTRTLLHGVYEAMRSNGNESLCKTSWITAVTEGFQLLIFIVETVSSQPLVPVKERAL